jgi:hypothetical protein
VRWLVDSVPTALLALLFVAGAVALALGATQLTRRLGLRSPSTGMDTMVSSIGAKTTALFGILLVFVIVSEFNHFNAAEGTAQREATALSGLVRSSWAFSPEAQKVIAADVDAYVSEVTDVDWPRLGRDGTSGPRTLTLLGRLTRDVQSYEPRSPSAAAFYTNAVTQLEAASDARRERVQSATRAIPDVLVWLLVAGAIAFVVSTAMFSAGAERVWLTATVSVAALAGAGLFVVVLLDYPFSGSLAISSDPFREGLLAHLRHP